MAFKGITFAGQNVTPKNDGALYNAHYGDGILDGCTMTISGDDLVIASGHFIAGGRVCQVDGATSVDLSGRTLTTGYIQVIMNYDLTQSEGSQWYTSFVESATTTFPALTQDDINGTGTLYQLQLAIVQISGGNLTSIYSQLHASNVVGGRNINLVGEETQLLFYNSDGTPSAVFGVWESDSFANIGKRRSSDGVPVAGARFYDAGTSGVILYGNGQNMVFRPNGVTDATGQMYIDADGYQHGGHPRLSETATISVSANTVKEICHIQAPVAGNYIIHFYGDLNPSSSGTGQVEFGIGYTSPTSRSIIDNRYMNGGSHVYCTSSWIAQMQPNEYIYFNIKSPVAGSVSGRLSAVAIL